MIPYVYLIGWTKLDTWYCGVQYHKGCNPQNLWKTYFTSSKYVWRFRKENGEPDHIEILKEFDNPKDARFYEQEILIKFDVLNKNNWLNRAIGGHFAGTRGPLSEETKRKISIAHQGKKHNKHSEKSIQQQKETFRKNYYSNYEIRFKKKSEKQKGRIITSNHRKKISQTLIGNKLSDETKLKISKATKGKKWFTNGTICKFLFECPIGFFPGRIINK